MGREDRALGFIIRALDGKDRKTEKDKPAVIHSMMVGDILRSYGFSDVVVAAGYLHDIIEETDYTLSDISLLFGGDVSSLVWTATNPPDISDWTLARKQKIKIIEGLPYNNIAVILADKIANLEDVRILAQKQGFVDFSKFRGGFEEQKWYYENIFEVIAANFDHPPMLERLYNNIRAVFYGENLFPEKNGSIQGSVNGQIDELVKIRRVLVKPEPYMVKLTNNPEAYSPLFTNAITDFFKPDNFKVKIMPDIVSNKKYDKQIISDQSLEPAAKELLIATQMDTGLFGENNGAGDIILVDSSLFERLTYLQRKFAKQSSSASEINEFLRESMPELENIVNCAVVNYPGLNEWDKNSSSYVASKKLLQSLVQSNAPITLFRSLLNLMRTESIRQLKLEIDANKNNSDLF